MYFVGSFAFITLLLAMDWKGDAAPWPGSFFAGEARTRRTMEHQPSTIWSPKGRPSRSAKTVSASRPTVLPSFNPAEETSKMDSGNDSTTSTDWKDDGENVTSVATAGTSTDARVPSITFPQENETTSENMTSENVTSENATTTSLTTSATTTAETTTAETTTSVTTAMTISSDVTSVTSAATSGEPTSVQFKTRKTRPPPPVDNGHPIVIDDEKTIKWWWFFVAALGVVAVAITTAFCYVGWIQLTQGDKRTVRKRRRRIADTLLPTWRRSIAGSKARHRDKGAKKEPSTKGTSPGAGRKAGTASAPAATKQTSVQKPTPMKAANPDSKRRP